MTYSISHVARQFHLEPHTLRYYEKEGIISPGKTDKGIRAFEQKDLDQLGLICCLRSTGMSIRDIKQYVDLCAAGESTTEERLQIFINHREHIVDEIASLQRHLEKIEYKIKNYSRIVKR